MRWQKLGHVYCADQSSDWNYSHAMVPIAERLEDSLFRIYYSPRDRWNRGHGAWLEVDMRDPLRILRVSPRPVLSPGDLGCFDDSGVLPNSIVTRGDEKLLFYTGINLGQTVPIRNSIGLARWTGESQRFERCFPGPVIDRTRAEPHFTATPEVRLEEGRFRVWYSSCVRWEPSEDGARHYYHVKYAESVDGVEWDRRGVVAVDFRDEYEYALAVPRVVRDRDAYRMWFCSRATRGADAYRIRYAESADGIEWVRRDEEVGIDVSDSGWDSEMMCYPFVFDHAGQRYMLYNGNGYGLTGFGIAVLVEDR